MAASLPAASLAPAAVRSPARLSYAWLFSPRADLTMLLVPVLLTAIAFGAALALGQDARGSARNLATWTAQFILGNTTHVVLTFVLLAARRDVLFATRGQAPAVILGSLGVFAGSLGLMHLVSGHTVFDPLYLAVVGIFAVHHTVSQVRGLWALYGLRGGKLGLPPPSARERSLQKLFAPLALLLIAVKWTLVGRMDAGFAPPFINVNPGTPAVLPFAVTHGLVAVWLAFAALLFHALLAYPAVSVPKVLYLGVQTGVVALELVSPGWGMTLAGGLHGLEYALLTRQMLAPTAAERGRTRLVDALIWPAMIAAMLPLLGVGLLMLPLGIGALGRFGVWATRIASALVLAHYCADALIYRFRIPEVRKVAMNRLGFAV